MSVVKRTIEVSLTFEVEIDEEKLLSQEAVREPEDIERAKKLLHAVLQDPEAEGFLAIHEIGAHIGDIGYDMGNLLTGLADGDFTPLVNVLKTLPSEDFECFMGNDNGFLAYEALTDAVKAKLDQIHVHKLQEQNHTPETGRG